MPHQEPGVHSTWRRHQESCNLPSVLQLMYIGIQYTCTASVGGCQVKYIESHWNSSSSILSFSPSYVQKGTIDLASRVRRASRAQQSKAEQTHHVVLQILSHQSRPSRQQGSGMCRLICVSESDAESSSNSRCSRSRSSCSRRTLRRAVQRCRRRCS